MNKTAPKNNTKQAKISVCTNCFKASGGEGGDDDTFKGEIFHSTNLTNRNGS